MATGLVVETAKEVKHEPTYQPGKTIEGLRIQEVIRAYERVGTEPLSRKMTDGDKVNASLRDFEKATGGTERERRNKGYLKSCLLEQSH